MKRIPCILFAVALLAASCTRQKTGRDTIVVSILPLKYLVTEITGDDFAIDVLVPPGSSPETYEPTQQQMISIADAKAIFTVGLIDFESELSAKISAQQHKDVTISELCTGIKVIAGSCSHKNHARNHGVDPHIWTSPRCLKVMATNMMNRISLLRPDSLKYRNNYIKLCEKLDSLDTQVAKTLKENHITTFIIYHPALTYYAADYGLTQISLEHEGKEPSAEHLTKLIDQARRDSCKVVLYQSQFSRSTVDAICNDLGIGAVEIDPLREDLPANIMHITEVMCGQ